MTRSELSAALVPFMAVTGFRFSKGYRWGITAFHRFVYAHIDTVGANVQAEMRRWQHETPKYLCISRCNHADCIDRAG